MRLRQSLEPFKHRRFAYQYAGFTVSVVGNTLSQVAITVGVLQVTGSGALAGMALSASTVALVLCILFGGVWADRLPRHLVMATMDCVRATSQIGVGVMLLADSVSVPLLLLLQVCFGAAQAFHLPASSGLTRFTVPKDQLQRANTLLSFSRSMSGVLGPLLAGALIATVGAGWALIGDGLSFLVSAGCAVLIKLPPGRPRGRRTGPCANWPPASGWCAPRRGYGPASWGSCAPTWPSRSSWSSARFWPSRTAAGSGSGPCSSPPSGSGTSSATCSCSASSPSGRCCSRGSPNCSSCPCCS
ncbi:hypothetical protein DI273_22370 [Streptomyces violascens]|nr:hypothetical protein DI273_22370 [Streptomyces violascens]